MIIYELKNVSVLCRLYKLHKVANSFDLHLILLVKIKNKPYAKYKSTYLSFI